MKKEMRKLEKELNKLRNREATGISIFIKKDSSVKNCAKEMVLGLKSMKKEKI